MPKLIEVTGLTRSYGDLVAVRDLHFSVFSGEIMGLVGPNGAGKTTTLRALAGIHRPTAGTVTICGHDVVDEPVAARQRLAFLPDEPRLFDYLTVEEHLQFMAKIYGVAEWRAEGERLLAELELDGKRRALPAELSRGMKQKLLIACGLLHRPEVLIFDEPLTGLDPRAIRKMKETIRRRAEGGAAIIISSHLLHLVEELCNSILIIRGGKKVVHGTIDSIRRMPEFAGGVSLEEAFIRLTDDETAGAGA